MSFSNKLSKHKNMLLIDDNNRELHNRLTSILFICYLYLLLIGYIDPFNLDFYNLI